MESPKSHGPAHPNPLLSLSTFVPQQCFRLGAELAAGLEGAKRLAGTLAGNLQFAVANRRLQSASTPSLFASLSQPRQALAATLGADYVAKTLAGTAVYTVSNANNEFVLISDPNGVKSIGLLCFRQEDAEAFLTQARSRKRELRSAAKVVPITLDQVYMLKVEGIAFRFLPDPIQIRNALELKPADTRGGFDGVPIFQSDLLVVKKKNKRFCPIYFRKEDIEKELLKVSRVSRGTGVSQHIMVGSLEDVLRRMETSEKSSGWEDLIFIPPGKSHIQHIQEVVKA